MNYLKIIEFLRLLLQEEEEDRQLPLVAMDMGTGTTKIKFRFIFMAPTVPNSTEPTFLAPANPLARTKNGIIPPRFITPR